MRHYEIVFIVHPDQSGQVPGMIDRYREMIESDQGSIHRLEDWGRRQLAYPISKVRKGHYVLMNIECSAGCLQELSNAFKYNDAIIRNLVIKRDHPVTDMSLPAKMKQEEDVAEKAKAEAEAKAKAEAEAKANAEAEAKANAEAQAAEEQAKAQAEVGEQAPQAAEEQAKAQAEVGEQAPQAAEEQAKAQAEVGEQAPQAAEEQAKAQAEVEEQAPQAESDQGNNLAEDEGASELKSAADAASEPVPEPESEPESAPVAPSEEVVQKKEE